MYALNGILMMEQEDISNLKLMTSSKFDQTAMTKESLTNLLDGLEERAGNIQNDAGDGDFMMKMIINEGVSEMRGQLAQLA